MTQSHGFWCERYAKVTKCSFMYVCMYVRMFVYLITDNCPGVEKLNPGLKPKDDNMPDGRIKWKWSGEQNKDLLPPA